MRALRHLRRLQMAEPALRGADQGEAEAGGRPATRIGKIELPEFRPIMGSVKTQEYRNKIEFGCSNKRWFTAEELSQLPQKEDDTVSSLKERHAQNAIGFHITGASTRFILSRSAG